MANDMLLVIGVGVLALAIPAIFSAVTDHRAPRIPAILILIGGGLIVLAVTRHPGGYTLQDVPDAFFRVIAQILH